MVDQDQRGVLRRQGLVLAVLIAHWPSPYTLLYVPFYYKKKTKVNQLSLRCVSLRMVL
jgi:hypothetical protein